MLASKASIIEYFNICNSIFLLGKLEISQFQIRSLPNSIEVFKERTMLSPKRSDFYYTLEDDERKCLASMQRIDSSVKEKISNQDSSAKKRTKTPKKS